MTTSWKTDVGLWNRRAYQANLPPNRATSKAMSTPSGSGPTPPKLEPADPLGAPPEVGAAGMAPEKGNDCGNPFWAPRAVVSSIGERSYMEKKSGISERSPLFTAAELPNSAFSLLPGPGERPSSRPPEWWPAGVDGTEDPERLSWDAAKAEDKLASCGEAGALSSWSACGIMTGELLSACRPGAAVGPSAAGSAIC